MTSSTKKSEGKQYVRFSNETLDLTCEWGKCTENFSYLSYFMDHIKRHINDYMKETEDEGGYICQWFGCNIPICDDKELERHIFFHAFHSKLKCYGRNFISRNTLPACTLDTTNCNLIPEFPEEFVCTWKKCDDSFENAEAFYRHVETHAEEYPKGKKISVKVACCWQGCSTNFTTVYRLKEHLRTHTQEKVVSCPYCGGMFSSRTKFFDHLQRQADNVDQTRDTQTKTSACTYCTKTFTTERILRNHMQSHVNHYKCPYCDMTVPTPSCMRAHIRYRHSVEKLHACNFCKHRSKTSNDLRRHLESHRSGDIFKCNVNSCLYTSTSNAALRKHMSSFHKVNQSQYVCHLCDSNFNRGNYLTKHLISKHGLSWPSGHSRFRYQLKKDGCYYLETIRYETYELSAVMMEESNKTEGDLSKSDSEKDIDEPMPTETHPVICDESMETVQMNSLVSTPDVVNDDIGPSSVYNKNCVVGTPEKIV